MSDSSPSLRFLPPETGQPPGISSEEEDVNSPSNKKVKNAHISAEDSSSLENMHCENEFAPPNIPNLGNDAPCWSQRVSLGDDSVDHRMDSVLHGMNEQDALFRGSGGDDPQPKQAKSYRDVVSATKSKEICFDENVEMWSDEEMEGELNSQNLDLNMNPSNEDPMSPVVLLME
ncbi:hypothetical protein LguiA_031855 [Lonicera macranthoides]